MNVRKTAALLRQELSKRGYKATHLQCCYYVRDVWSKQTANGPVPTMWYSKDYVRTSDGKKSFPINFVINLAAL